jgi:hypothetical protein
MIHPIDTARRPNTSCSEAEDGERLVDDLIRLF